MAARNPPASPPCLGVEIVDERMRIAQAPTIRAVVLDLDDCLYPERQYVRGGYGAAARHLRSLGYEGPFETWLWSRFLRGEGGGAFDALNAAFALGLSPDRLEQLVRVYREHVPSIRPRGGMIELLGRLHEHFRMGLLSDGYLPAQRLKLAALKIERFFDAVVLTEELGRGAWKPSPVGFEAIRE